MGYSEDDNGRRPPVVVEEVRYYLVPSDRDYSLPLYRPRRRQGVRLLEIAAPILIGLSCLLLTGAAVVFWPSQPRVELKHWELNGINIYREEEPRSFFPVVYLNVSLDVILQIKNPNYVGIYYDYLEVEIRYRGSHLGDVKLKGGHILARRTELVPATLNLEAKEILENASELLADFAHRELPLTTNIKIIGNVDLWAVRPHIDAGFSCDFVVDPKTKLVKRGFCVWPGLPISGILLEESYGPAIAPSFGS